MFSFKKIILILVFGLCFFSLNSYYYGKNKIQQEKINWSLIESRHFDVYFVSGHEEFGKLVVLMAENAYYHLNQFFRHPILNRIPIIVYSSKQDFQSTNIIYPLLTEGIGGFTETLRNRVSLPFDGSYKKFEEILIHELVHAYINDIEGAFFRDPFLRSLSSNLPFWFSEGLPEYLALKGNDISNQKFIIDMIINDQLRDMEFLGGFFAYRLGESLLVWIAEEWSDTKVTEYFYNIRTYPDIHNATKVTFGFDFTELQNKFRLYVKRKYSHMLNDTNVPWEIATRHTIAKETHAYQNIFPRFSPNGNDFIFFSSHKARTSILKGSTYKLNNDKVVLIGERTARFEEFHFDRNNIVWLSNYGISAQSDISNANSLKDNGTNTAEQNNQTIAFVAKTAFADVIYFYDVERKRVVSEFSFPEFDSIYEIDVSPCNNFIAITAQKENKCDLYIYNISTNELKQLTDDFYFAYSPAWSSDGQNIAFVSERYIGPLINNDNESIDSTHLFGKMAKNIYYCNVHTGDFFQITHDTYDNYHPKWINDAQIAFITDKSGISHINIIDINENTRATVTNMLSGIHSFDYSNVNETLIFSVYFENAFDIYSLLKPFQKLDFYDYKTNTIIKFIDDFHSVFNTDRYQYYGRDFEAEENLRNQVNTGRQRRNRSRQERPSESVPEPIQSLSDDSDTINEPFSPASEPQSLQEGKDNDLDIILSKFFPLAYQVDLRPDTLNFKTPVIKKYKPRFQIDNFWGGFAYSPSYGSVGMLQLGLSDIMGDHGIGVSMDFNGAIEESNIVFNYMYLPHRLDYGFAVYNFVDYVLYRDRSVTPTKYFENREYQTGVYFTTRYPLSRFFRLELDHQVYRYRSEWHEWESTFGSWQKITSVSDYIYVPQFGYVFDNALYGSTGPMAGSKLSSFIRHGFSQKNNSFTTVYNDLRHYNLFANRYALAQRLVFGFSEGQNPERFSLTGLNGIRGFDDRSLRGNRKAMTSVELRYPFVDILRMSFPLPMTITNIRGSLFTDFGSVWSSEDFRGMKDGKLEDLKMGFGFGPRLNLGFFVLSFDIAWTTDFMKHSKPSFYFSLYEDF